MSPELPWYIRAVFIWAVFLIFAGLVLKGIFQGNWPGAILSAVLGSLFTRVVRRLC